MSKRRSSKPSRHRNLGLEPLESRVVLDGNVRAFLAGNVLRIEGDSRDNEIIIRQSSLRSFTIESRDGSTTINRQAGPLRFNGARDDLNISLKGGSDVVEILGTAVDAVTVSDRLFINTGSGSDQVLLTEVHGIGLHINTGSGNDLINVGQDGTEGGLEVTKEAIIVTGSGRDTATITNSNFKRFLTLDMGSNDDETTILETRFRRSSVAIGGSGFDTLNREGNSGPIRYISYNRVRNTVDEPAPLPPIANSDSASVVRGSNTTINVAANDSSASSSLNLGSIAITQQPTSGTVAVNTNGTVTYTNNGAAATSDSFQYTIRDQQGNLSNPATVSVAVVAAFAAVNDASTVTEDSTTNTTPPGNVFSNDTGGVGTRTVTAVNGVAGNVGTNVNGTFGTFRINADGSFTYTLDNTNTTVNNLNAGQTLTDTMSYTASAGGGATSTANLAITIQGATDTPLAAVADSGSVTEDAAATNTATGNVLTNDTGGTGTKTVTSVNGSTTSVGVDVQRDHGTFRVNADGTYTYTLNNSDPDLATLDAGETLTDTITYVVSAGGATSTATLTITIQGTTELAAAPDSGSVTEDAATNTATGNVLTNDTGGTGTKTVTSVNGSTTSVGVDVQRDHGTFRVNADGTYTYTLNNSDPDLATLDATETLTDTITYVVTAGGVTATATLTITIQGTTELAAAPDSASVTEDAAATNSATGNVLTNDTGGTGTKTVTSVNGSTTSVGVDVQRDHGTFRINADGTYTYTLNNSDPDLATLDAGETLTDTITYVVTAGGATATATLTVTIQGTTELAAAPDSGTVTEDAATNTVTGDVLTNDTGGTGTKTVTSVNGSTTSVGVDVQRDHGTFRVNADGTYTYTLNNADPDLVALDAGETVTDTITYVVTAGGTTSTATLTITIAGANDLAAAADSGSVTEDAATNTATGNVLTNDTGGTGTKAVTSVNGSTTSVGVAVQRAHGTFLIEADGDFTYTLDNGDTDLATLDDGQVLTDTIDYTVTAGGETSTATLTITINGATDN